MTCLFQEILDESIYPDIWKLANVTLIHKKENKQQTTKTTKTTDRYPYYLFVEKSLKKLFSIIFTTT